MVAGCDKDFTLIDDTKEGSIFGVVTDFATGEPVQNANVQLRPGGETTLTGLDGTYEFLDIPDGRYSITVSKAEYTDLIDDYIIDVKSGRRVRRDVQIKKLPVFIRITDLSGKDISMLDFGADASLVTKSFNIFNNGTVNVSCKIVYSCSWISSVSAVPASIKAGQTVPVIVN
ncbi:MAG: carboxypeptidase-like regulatory domain-containing protein, partial [Muribaculaceae bacterium]|nr:carboxypeptidase-like regulatory domain-containing protein [Muribaculaceae bacterium]